jgi:hypothetical protein
VRQRLASRTSPSSSTSTRNRSRRGQAATQHEAALDGAPVPPGAGRASRRSAGGHGLRGSGPRRLAPHVLAVRRSWSTSIDWLFIIVAATVRTQLLDLDTPALPHPHRGVPAGSAAAVPAAGDGQPWHIPSPVLGRQLATSRWACCSSHARPAEGGKRGGGLPRGLGAGCGGAGSRGGSVRAFTGGMRNLRNRVLGGCPQPLCGDELP